MLDINQKTMNHKRDAIKKAEEIMIAHRKSGLSELGAHSAAIVTVKEILNVLNREEDITQIIFTYSLYKRTLNYLERGWKSTHELLSEEIEREEANYHTGDGNTGGEY